MQNNNTFSNREALQSMLPLGANDTFSNKIVLDSILTGPPLSNSVVRFLSATQAAFLDGKTFSSGEYFNPVQDFQGQWFISTTETSPQYPWILDLPTGNFALDCVVCPNGQIPPTFLDVFFKLNPNDTFSNDSALSRSIPEIYPYCFEEE
jgi:hypothetical protein